MPTRLLALTLLCLLLGATAAVPAALAQSDPFGPIPQAPPEQPEPQPVQLGQEEDDGLNATQELLIGIAGIVLLFGIGWAIIRDARSAAPVDADHPLDEGDRPKGSRTPPKQRVKRSRAKAKAARRARKHNR
jgi:hypothetical protein